jgi:hypothetical protein
VGVSEVELVQDVLADLVGRHLDGVDDAGELVQAGLQRYLTALDQAVRAEQQGAAWGSTPPSLRATTNTSATATAESLHIEVRERLIAQSASRWQSA